MKMKSQCFFNIPSLSFAASHVPLSSICRLNQKLRRKSQMEKWREKRTKLEIWVKWSCVWLSPGNLQFILSVLAVGCLETSQAEKFFLKEFGHFLPGGQVDFGKGDEVAEVLPEPSLGSQEQLMACSQTEFSLATETVEGLENEEFQEKLDEEEKNKSPKTFPLCTSARREHGEENNNKKKTNGEELIYFKLFSWHQARMLLPRAAKQLWLRCLLGKLGISMQTGQAPVSPPLLLAVASGAANPSLLPPESCFLSCPPGRNNLAEALLGFPSQALWKEGEDSRWLEQDLQSTQPRRWMQQEVLKGKEKKTICSAEHQRQIFLRPSHWFHTFSRS